MTTRRILITSATMTDNAVRQSVIDFGSHLSSWIDIHPPLVRPHVFLSVAFQHSPIPRDRHEKIARWVRSFCDRSVAVVFVSTRKEAESFTMALSKLGFSCGYLHGGLDKRQRDLVFSLWDDDIFQLLITTKAGALGINKEGVRGVYVDGGAMSVTDAIQMSGCTGPSETASSMAVFALSAEVLFRNYVFCVDKGKEVLA